MGSAIEHEEAGRTRGGRQLPPRPSYAVGIVHYHAYDDLERCLAHVEAQSLLPSCVVVVDNDSDPTSLAEARSRRPGVVFEPLSNRGFAPAANAILERVGKLAEGTEFCLILNPDVELEADFGENLLRELATDADVAIGCGKLLRPDTGRIDSAGIKLPRNRRPRDRGSEQPDLGQFDRREVVFGASGAALAIRLAAVPDLAIEGEVFDEDFFMYHEDTDLSWRANLLGWKVLYVPDARGRHRRRWRRNERFDMPAHVRQHSFKNHYLQMIKNETPGDFLKNLPVILAWELLRLGYALLRDPAVLAGYVAAWRKRGNAWRKRRILQERARLVQRATGPSRSHATP